MTDTLTLFDNMNSTAVEADMTVDVAVEARTYMMFKIGEFVFICLFTSHAMYDL